MTKLARERGRSGFLWSLAASGAWLVVELTLLGLAFLGILIARTVLDWKGDLGSITFLLYLGPLTAGMIASEKVKRRLEAIPTLEEEANDQPIA